MSDPSIHLAPFPRPYHAQTGQHFGAAIKVVRTLMPNVFSQLKVKNGC